MVVPAYRNTEDRVDGVSAVHPDFVDQRLEQTLDRSGRPLRHRLSHAFTEYCQFLWRMCGEIGLAHFVREDLTTYSQCR